MLSLFSKKCDLLGAPFNDHSPILLQLKEEVAPNRGPGTWKLNTGLLMDDTYCVCLRSFWSDFHTEKSRFKTLAEWWDCGKSLLKDMSIHYSVQQAGKK